MHEIALHDVTFSYGSQTILEEINFTAYAGEFVCLLGPSGCGKSTLLRLLAGLGQPSSGRVTLDGSPIAGPGLDRGMVFQDYSLFPWMTTGQNVVLALNQAFPGKSKAEQAETAQAYLEMVGLNDVFNKLPGALSGGMWQRAVDELTDGRLDVDLVLSSYVLNIIPDGKEKSRYLKNIVLNLRAEGYLLVEVRCRMASHDCSSGCARGKRCPNCIKTYSHLELDQLVESQGFRCVSHYYRRHSVAVLYQRCH